MLKAKAAGVAAAAMAAASLLGACGSGDSSRATSTTAQDQSGGSASQVKAYGSLSQVADDSGIVVSGVRATGTKTVSADEEGISGTTSSLVRFTVSRVAKGSSELEGQTLLVRQIDNGVGMESPEPALREGSSYTLFLKPFEFQPGKSTGQYVVVDYKAAYVDTGDGRLVSMVAPSQSTAKTQLSAEDEASPSGIPTVVTYPEIEKAISAG